MVAARRLGALRQRARREFDRGRLSTLARVEGWLRDRNPFPFPCSNAMSIAGMLRIDATSHLSERDRADFDERYAPAPTHEVYDRRRTGLHYRRAWLRHALVVRRLHFN